MAYGTIKVDTIENTNGQTGNAIGPGFKNRIINGAMVIDQRVTGSSAIASPTGAYPVDRWFGIEDTDGAMTAEKVTDAPAGFINSIKLTTTTADGSLTTTQTAQLMQNIEGFNVSDLSFGSASAKTVTLSFWVKSSLTGTMGGSLRNSAADRSYPFSYTINAANTWEQKSVTIAGDTSGTWLSDNGIGIRLVFSLGCGPSRLGTAGAWNSNNNTGPTGEVPVIGTLNATWYITGVQLEVGPSATSFDYRPYGTELMLCQRYYYKNTATTAYGAFSVYAPAVSGTAIYIPIQLPVTMRDKPSALETSNIAALDGVNTYTGGTFVIDSVSNSPSYVSVNYTHGSSVFTQYRTYGYRGNNSTTAYLAFSAEL